MFRSFLDMGLKLVLFLILLLVVAHGQDVNITSTTTEIDGNQETNYHNTHDSLLFEPSNDSSLTHLNLEELTILQFILDLTKWTDWDSVVIFSSNSSDLMRSSFIPIFSYFNRNGKYVAIHSIYNHLLPQSLLHRKHEVGAVVIYDEENDEFLQRASNLELFDPYRSWVFLVREPGKKEKLKFKLSIMKVHIDSNVILANLERPPEITTRPPRTTTAAATKPPDKSYGKKDRSCTAEYEKENKFSEACANGSAIPHRLKRQISGDPRIIIHLNQIYKVSKTDMDSLVETDLGAWDTANGFINIDLPFELEGRSSLRGYKLLVGVKNMSMDPNPGFVLDNDEVDEDSPLSELLDCMMFGLNSSYEFVQYSKIGLRSDEGVWTHLLGAVVDGAVDFALNTIDMSHEKAQDMFFTYPIVKSENNIYFLRPDGGGMRDIFLEPFSPKLILCVFGTGFLLSVAMISITLAGYHILKYKHQESKVLNKKKIERNVMVEGSMERRYEVSEAALWSISILCMQGSPWSPNSMSGSLLLISSLIFALIIYNSYAAFITSVLSVKDLKIRTLEDLQGEDFSFGYTLGGTDDQYLRTINDSQLREFYFKGLKENDGVNDPIEGMHLATKGDYAFFVSARTARKALRSVISHSQRCKIQELQLPQTKTEAALPMSRKSPYKKILNYKVLRMMESGILQRLRKEILPPMPRCVERSKFNSARLTDVYSAFTVLGSGWVASIIILIFEILWAKKKGLKKKEISGVLKKQEAMLISPYWLK